MNKSLLLLFCALLHTVGVSAHTPSESFSVWALQDGVLTVQFTVSAREASRLSGFGTVGNSTNMLADYFSHSVFPDERRCSLLESGRSLASQPGWFRLESRWQCNGQPDTLTAKAFFNIAAEHTHYATYLVDNLVRQNVFTQDQTEWDLTLETATGNPSRQILWFGVRGFKHVIAGVDHLVFLLALLLTLRSTRDIVLAVTGFTLGHTLALAAIGFGNIAIKTGAIESLIGLSVCVVCVEYLFQRESMRAIGYSLLFSAIGLAFFLKLFLLTVLSCSALIGVSLMFICYLEFSRFASQPAAWRLLVTLVFGLTHGAGFATGFTAAGASKEGLLPALASFNLGVEIGQLAFIAGVAGVIHLCKVKRIGVLSDCVVALLFGVGIYWFLGRGFQINSLSL
ncbi:MAG: HupE/UreJ family protein [Gammaproteobacteria bacterium]